MNRGSQFLIAPFAGRVLLAGVLVAMYAPVAMIVVYSFNESKIGGAWSGFSFRWYGELMRQRDLWAGLQTSLIVGGFASSFSVVVGTLAAIGLRRWTRRSRALAQGLLALPLVVPDMILAVSLALFFHSLQMRQGLFTVTLAHTTFGISYAFVVMSSAVRDLDDTLFEAARDAGATAWQAFRKVTIPILLPSLLLAWLFVFALSFDDFLITFLTKGPGTDTLPIKIYSRMRFGVRPDTNALFSLLFVFTLLGVGLASLVSRRGGLFANARSGTRR